MCVCSSQNPNHCATKLAENRSRPAVHNCDLSPSDQGHLMNGSRQSRVVSKFIYPGLWFSEAFEFAK